MSEHLAHVNDEAAIQTWYGRLDVDRYLACISNRCEENMMVLTLPEDYQREWMHCYRFMDGALSLDEDKKAAQETLSASKQGSTLASRVMMLEEQVGEIIPAQIEALGILGVTMDG